MTEIRKIKLTGDTYKALGEPNNLLLVGHTITTRYLFDRFIPGLAIVVGDHIIAHGQVVGRKEDIIFLEEDE